MDPPDDAYEPQFRQVDIPVIVHHSTTLDHNLAPTFEIPKTGMILSPVRDFQIGTVTEGHEYRFLSKPILRIKSAGEYDERAT